MLQVAHYIYAFIIISNSSSWSAWNQYQALGTIMINSGLLNNLAQVLIYVLTEKILGRQRTNTKLGLLLLIPQILIILPFVLTHSLPAIILYIWMIIPLGIFLFGFFLLADSVPYESTLEHVLKFAFLRLTPFVGIVVLQTAYNYMILYEMSTPYLRVITDEWDLRNTLCYRTNLYTSAQHTWALTTYLV